MVDCRLIELSDESDSFYESTSGACWHFKLKYVFAQWESYYIIAQFELNFIVRVN